MIEREYETSTTPNTNRPTQPGACDRHVTGAGAVVKGKRFTRVTTPTLIAFNPGGRPVGFQQISATKNITKYRPHKFFTRATAPPIIAFISDGRLFYIPLPHISFRDNPVLLNSYNTLQKYYFSIALRSEENKYIFDIRPIILMYVVK